MSLRPDAHEHRNRRGHQGRGAGDPALLAALARRAGRIVGREELYETVWEAPMRADERSVDVYVHKLRSELAEAAPEWTFIHTHFRFGDRFQPERSHLFHNSATGR